MFGRNKMSRGAFLGELPTWESIEDTANPSGSGGRIGDAAVSADYRVAVFGAGGVGKSSIVQRFVKGTFSENYVPTIEDTYRQVIIRLIAREHFCLGGRKRQARTANCIAVSVADEATELLFNFYVDYESK
ncbi:hypothetical protein OSTOST_08236, partial [Ostertagia ostertagi]